MLKVDYAKSFFLDEFKPEKFVLTIYENMLGILNRKNGGDKKKWRMALLYEPYGLFIFLPYLESFIFCLWTLFQSTRIAFILMIPYLLFVLLLFVLEFSPEDMKFCMLYIIFMFNLK